MIIALEEAKRRLVALKDDVKELGNALRIEDLKAKTAELEAQTLDPNFWNNPESSTKITQTIKQSKDTIEEYEKCRWAYQRYIHPLWDYYPQYDLEKLLSDDNDKKLNYIRNSNQIVLTNDGIIKQYTNGS
jgi:hypothetical protein